MSQRRVKGPWELEALAVVQSDDLKMNAKDRILIPVIAENWTDPSADNNHNACTCVCVYVFLCIYNLEALKNGQRQAEFRENLTLKRRHPYTFVKFTFI